jgi:hypothetical protein
MAGTIAAAPLEALASTLPTASQVENELQRIARRRLDRPANAETPPRSDQRSGWLKQRASTLAGGFDSPAGFVFVAAGSHRKR